jgi:DNA-directed RNA polymerase specialized sigma24 family protein
MGSSREEDDATALLAANARELRTIARRMPRCLRVEAQDTDDVIQEAWLLARTSVTPLPRDEAGRCRWLAALLKVATREHLKKQRRREAREELLPMEELPPCAGGIDVEALCEMAEALWRCLPRLPEALRRMFRRVDIEGADVATVAEEEDISTAAAWKRLQRARVQMKAELDALDREGEQAGRCAMVLPLLASLMGFDRMILSAVVSVVPPPGGAVEAQDAQATEPPASVPPASGVHNVVLGAAIAATALALGSDAMTGGVRLTMARTMQPPMMVVVLPPTEAPRVSVPAAPCECTRGEQRPAARTTPVPALEFKDLASLVEAYAELHDEGKADRARRTIERDEQKRPDAPEKQARDDLRAAAERAAEVKRAP